MKTVIIASALAVAAIMASQASATMDELRKYEWKNRVVVLFGGSGDQKLARQVELLRSHEKDLANRDMVVITVIGDEVRPVYGDATGVDARKLRQQAGIEGNAFEAVLIGKDGGVKLRSSEVVTDEAMFGLIDRMPMRKNGQG
ncbi:DUF4174 domain-containing protein [Rhizobium sp. HT1-10]|uniref:DUF4174 domain-containing protein n=1 Tax=Rhizobium sp. HT1-10 TaxID=3111638 RepID=UPI003C14877F